MVRKARSARQIYLVQSALGPEADATNGSNWPILLKKSLYDFCVRK